MSSFDACADTSKRVEAALGSVEILVNNAGSTRDATLYRMTAEQWSVVISTNLGSLFDMRRHVIGGMRARKFGRVVNISSINGQEGQLAPVQLCGRQGGRARLHQGAGAGIRAPASR